MRRALAVSVVATVIAALLAAACGAAPTPTPAAPAPRDRAAATEAFTAAMVAAFAARDARAAAQRYATDAVTSLVGVDGEVRGRAAIEADLRDTFARYPDAALRVGRTWASAEASVVELVFRGTRTAGALGDVTLPGGPIGVRAAAILIFDDAGLVTTQRLYLDVVTLVGQLDPTRLPAGVAALPVATEPPAGTAVVVPGGTASEASNRALGDAVWAAMEAGRPAEALAPMADDYVYVDLVAPAPLDRAGTEQLVAGFLAVVADFRIVARPVQIAAGDDVVTEIVEHATLGGRPIVLHALDIRRVVAGRIHREWQYSNYLEVVRQLRGP